MTKWVDENALQYFRKRTEVQSTGNTITISEKNNKRFPGTLTKSDIDVNLDNIIDNNTILKNNNKLKSGLTLAKITTGLPVKVKERYALKDNQGNVIGSEIDIYYDSSLVEVYLGNTDDRLTNVPDPSTGKNYTITKSVSGEDALCFVFVLDTGLYELVSVPVGDFLRESEFKDGLNVSNHEVSAKISDGLEFGNAGIGVNKPVKIKLHNKYVGPSVALRDGISVLNVDSNGLSLDLENLLQRSFKSSSYINLVLTQAGASPLSTGQVLLPILQPEANVVTISSATSQNNGLATANDVKQYVEGNTYWRSDGTYQTSGIYTATNTASGTYSVAEGYDSTAGANYSHAEGCQTVATGLSSHAEGESTTASGDQSHAEGDGTSASGDMSHAEGNDTSAQGDYSHTEGYGTVASGESSHAEGAGTLASGDYSHAEGSGVEAYGQYSHAEGFCTAASGESSHAEGDDSVALEECSHAEGDRTISAGNASHSEGAHTTAWGDGSHAEGSSSGSTTKSTFTISGSAGIMGYVSSQDHGLVVGSVIKYNNIYAAVVQVDNATHFTLDKTLSSDTALTNVYVDIITGISYGNCSHVENKGNIAVGVNSHAEGLCTITNNDNEHACGKYNLSTPDQTLFSIGNGTSDSDRRNVFEVTQDGNIIGGSFSSGISTQTINTSDTAPVVTKSGSIILLEQDSRIPPFLDLESFSMSPGQHVTIFLTHTFNSLSVSLILGYGAYIYTQGNVDYKLGPEVHNITAQYSKIDIVRISTHQWTITLY